MKSITTLALLLLALPVFPQKPKPPINLSISIIEGEHSRDSNSTRTTITIKGNHLVYDQSHSGYRGKQRQPIHRDIVVKNEDMEKLRELIRSRELFNSATLVRPTDNPSRYSILTLKTDKRKSVVVSKNWTVD